jgi:hypothetical protein
MSDIACMTLPRQVVPGRDYMITRRCSERRFFLRPDDDTNDAFIYCLGLAAMPSVPRLHAKPPRQSRKSSKTRWLIPPLHSRQSLLLWGITCAHLVSTAPSEGPFSHNYFCARPTTNA